MYSVGTIVEVFEDPLTKRVKEGDAKIISHVMELEPGVHQYEVNFIGDGAAARYVRTIANDSNKMEFVLSTLKSTFDGKTAEVIAIKYGERGYYPTTWGRQTEDWVKDQNAGMGVDQATVLAFDCCSLFGRWENFEKVRESMKRQLDKATKPMEAGNV
jgi:hypothetical protein